MSDFLDSAAPDPHGQEIPSLSDGRECPNCGELRKIAEFARDRSKASGRKSHCKLCDAAKAKSYYEANRERVIARVSARNRSRSE
jgi:hypothetical protein